MLEIVNLTPNNFQGVQEVQGEGYAEIVNLKEDWREELLKILTFDEKLKFLDLLPIAEKVLEIAVSAGANNVLIGYPIILIGYSLPLFLEKEIKVFELCHIGEKFKLMQAGLLIRH